MNDETTWFDITNTRTHYMTHELIMVIIFKIPDLLLLNVLEFPSVQ